MTANARRPVPGGHPVVVKAGSSSLVHGPEGLNVTALARTVDHVVQMWDRGYPTLLVSSGAVAAGLPVLGMDRRPEDVPRLQVAAAVGQGRLMERYAALFAEREMVVGQILLTKDLLANRDQYLHAREAMKKMLSLRVVPIVNENDTVVVDELRIGDNDRLAAIVSHLVSAGILVVLTDTKGLYSNDPNKNSDAELFDEVHSNDQALDLVLKGGAGRFGSGGAATKIAAARMAAWSGIPTVIADAREEDVVARAVAGEDVGTWLAPHQARLPARKLWIAFGQPADGVVRVDGGAVGALVGKGGSLLAVGVVDVDGEFGERAPVEVFGPGDRLVAKGLVAMSAGQIRESIGKQTSQAGGVVIHRDDLVILAAR
ncbi:MAG: glutamate 5-kinase [Acidimicrobiia bacterium]